jgi:simple sugar transport system permease protein
MKVHPIAYSVAALALLLLFNAFFTDGFFAIELRDGRLYGSLVDVLNRAAPVMLLSLGMTLVIATRGVDLSVGAVMAIAGAVAAVLANGDPGKALGWLQVSHSVPLVVLCALVVATLAGVFNGVLVGRFGVQPIVATLILMVAGRGVAQLVTEGQIVLFENPSLELLANGSVAAVPTPVVIVALAFVTVAVLVRKTALGLFIEAVGSNAKAARLAGVASAGVVLAVYAVSGLMAGVAGVIACANISAADSGTTGLYLELDAILAVAVGGTSLAGGRFSLAGSLVGAVLMQALTTTILTRGVSPHATLVAKALIIVAVILLQSPALRASLRAPKEQAA